MPNKEKRLEILQRAAAAVIADDDDEYAKAYDDLADFEKEAGEFDSDEDEDDL